MLIVAIPLLTLTEPGVLPLPTNSVRGVLGSGILRHRGRRDDERRSETSGDDELTHGKPFLYLPSLLTAA
jgi:hypothetical protein